MDIEIERVGVAEILPLRELHRRAMACQIVHDSLHERGFTHPYLISVDGETIGYGTVFGFGGEEKDTVDEFYLHVDRRPDARRLFERFVEASSATEIQAQTNDRLLSILLFDFARDIRRDRILFDDAFESELRVPGAAFRRRVESDAGRSIDGLRIEQAGDWVLEAEGEIVAAGGILCHYNPPYGDLYMTVAEARRGRGYGSFFVQELKRACYEMGRVPAARCDEQNLASRATLARAGMLPCGGILRGRLSCAPGDRSLSRAPRRTS